MFGKLDGATTTGAVPTATEVSSGVSKATATAVSRVCESDVKFIYIFVEVKFICISVKIYLCKYIKFGSVLY